MRRTLQSTEPRRPAKAWPAPLPHLSAITRVPLSKKSSSGKEVIVGFNAKHGFFRPPLALSPFLPTTHALVPKYATSARDAKNVGNGELAHMCRQGSDVQRRKLSLSQEAVSDPTNFPPWRVQKCHSSVALSVSEHQLPLPWLRRYWLRSDAELLLVTCSCFSPITTYTLTLTPRRS